jgi:hypothetical protein
MAFNRFPTRIQRLIVVGTAIVMILPIAACNQSKNNGSEKFSSAGDFAQVCNNIPLDVAPAYIKNNPQRSVAFFQRKDPQSSFEFAMYAKLPTSWRIGPDNFRDNQLVICVSKKAEKLVKTCDQYEVEDKLTKEKKKAKLELYDVDYEFVAYEAKTAKVLESKALSAKVDQVCPSVVAFSGGDDAFVTRYYAEYEQTLLEFVKSHL